MGEVQEEGREDYGWTTRYQEELLDVWWQIWKEQGFPHLLPYHHHKQAKRHSNLKVGDICLLKYETKI